MPTRPITTVADLVALVGVPVPAVAAKVRSRLTELDRQWLAASSFCLLATADEEGRCDVSPKGDPAGQLAHVVDEQTIAIAERPGNRRVDGYRNVLANPHAGLLFLIPGRGDTLRVNGRAQLVSDAPFFDRMVVRGQRPLLALVLEVEEVFYHCSKAFLRAELWDPATWGNDLPSRAEIAHAVERPETSLVELREHYGPGYAERLYG